MATISSVVATPGYFPGVSVTINGTGFGASQGTLLLVFPNQGLVLPCEDVITWSATSISGFTLPLLDENENENDFGEVTPDKLDQTFFYVVVPVGETIGARSANYTFVRSTVADTVIPNNTIVIGYNVDQDAPETPFGGHIGFVSQFDNPGYSVYWYESPDGSGVFIGDYGTSSETSIAPMGESVLASFMALGYTFSTQLPA